ncbi:unnamed protein product, partial [Meganyctiphanes norvegica]
MAEFSGHNTGCVEFLGLKMAPLNIPIQRRLQTASVFAWVATILFAGWAFLLLLIYLGFFTNYWWLSLAYLTWYYGDRAAPHKGGGRRRRWLGALSVWRHFANYFPMEVIKTAELPPDKNYILAYHPHGVMALGTTAIITEGAGFSQIIKTSKLYPAQNNIVIYYPHGFLGLLSMEGAEEVLRIHPDSGKAIVVVPGGSQETLESRPGKASLVLKNKAGFIKMALKHGASLVPVYGFGETDVYDQNVYPDTSLVRKFQRLLNRFLGFSPVIIKGRGIFQYSWGVLPRRKPINIVVMAILDVNI